MAQLGEPLYRKQEPTGYTNAGAEWMNSAALLARMNFAVALAANRIPGVKVDAARFGDAEDTSQIARALMLPELSDASRAAINAGSKQNRARLPIVAESVQAYFGLARNNRCRGHGHRRPDARVTRLSETVTDMLNRRVFLKNAGWPWSGSAPRPSG